jgi:hypothetical protein
MRAKNMNNALIALLSLFASGSLPGMLLLGGKTFVEKHRIAGICMIFNNLLIIGGSIKYK